MTPKKIVEVARFYLDQLYIQDVVPVRMDPTRTFGSLTPSEHLSHAAHLICNVLMYIDENKVGKAMRHLSAAQMNLSCANWYTLRELMDHNRE